VANCSSGIPFAILILPRSCFSLPPSLVEAARVDGAGCFRRSSRSCCRSAGTHSHRRCSLSLLLERLHFSLTLTPGWRAAGHVGIYQYLGTQVQNWNAVMATPYCRDPAIVLLVPSEYIAAGAIGGAVNDPPIDQGLLR